MKDGDWMHSDQPSQRRRLPEEGEDGSGKGSRTDFEIPLNTLLECLNIFGTATAAPTNLSSGSKVKKEKRLNNQGSDEEGAEGRRGALDNFFAAAGGQDKKTGMRMSYNGAGYPLTLIMSVGSGYGSSPI